MPSILETLAGWAQVYDGRVVVTDGAEQETRAGLAARVAAVAEQLASAPRVLGLFGENSAEWLISQLAGWTAGKIVVPFPPFFSAQQLSHLVRDAGVSHVIVTGGATERLAPLGLEMIHPTRGRTLAWPGIRPDGGQIIYTSGSTGAPKGVRLDLGQINHSAHALARAISARDRDVHLSLLPLPLLLETICAVCVPLLAGAKVVLEPAATSSIARGAMTDLRALFAQHQPTTSVLVPQLLMQWVCQLDAAKAQAPGSLRMVAVGGAPLSGELAARGWSLGIPIHEGYGLSECCSVVSLNCPGRRAPGTVGQALEGLTVTIDDGEICVAGPTVMRGYTDGHAGTQPWRTGDLGHFDGSGNLVIDGRKDNLIVLAGGRNISPEWIETKLMADPCVLAAAVTGHGHDGLTALIITSPAGAGQLTSLPNESLAGWGMQLCRDLPHYALPHRWHAMAADVAMAAGVLTGNGRINRKAAAAHLATLDAPAPDQVSAAA